MDELPPFELGYARTELRRKLVDAVLVPAGEIDVEFDRDEGEGFETVEDWRRAHESFWAGHDIDDDTLIVAERFRLVERGADG